MPISTFNTEAQLRCAKHLLRELYRLGKSGQQDIDTDCVLRIFEDLNICSWDGKLSEMGKHLLEDKPCP